jgi:hypothetical protein
MKRLATLLVCGLVLTFGFVFAARQQFAAVHFGYQSEDLRREHERLLDEQRRLLLKLEESASPAQLERAARELGLQPACPSQLGITVSTPRMTAAEPLEVAASSPPSTKTSSRRRTSTAFIGTATTTASSALRR